MFLPPLRYLVLRYYYCRFCLPRRSLLRTTAGCWDVEDGKCPLLCFRLFYAKLSTYLGARVVKYKLLLGRKRDQELSVMDSFVPSSRSSGATLRPTGEASFRVLRVFYGSCAAVFTPLLLCMREFVDFQNERKIKNRFLHSVGACI